MENNSLQNEAPAAGVGKQFQQRRKARRRAKELQYGSQMVAFILILILLAYIAALAGILPLFPRYDDGTEFLHERHLRSPIGILIFVAVASFFGGWMYFELSMVNKLAEATKKSAVGWSGSRRVALEQITFWKKYFPIEIGLAVIFFLCLAVACSVFLFGSRDEGEENPSGPIIFVIIGVLVSCSTIFKAHSSYQIVDGYAKELEESLKTPVEEV